jgi:hypothetical protein
MSEYHYSVADHASKKPPMRARAVGPAQRHGPAPAAVFKAVVDCGGMAAAELELNIGTSTSAGTSRTWKSRLGLTCAGAGVPASR